MSSFFFVCCSRSARSKHVFLNILVVQYGRGVVNSGFTRLSNKIVILLKCRRRVTAVGTAVW